MSFRCLGNWVGSPIACAGLTLVLLSGCGKNAPVSTVVAQTAISKPQIAQPAVAQHAVAQPLYQGVVTTALSPGAGRTLFTIDPRAAKYYDNPKAVKAGEIIFKAMNCSGCHTNGGGAMGPSLMGDHFIYGDRLEQIHQTLVEGRPNGMPSWGASLSDEALWELAAYVRSMSLPATLAAQGSGNPSQSPAPVPRAADEDPGWAPPSATTNDYTTTLTGPEGPQ
jgi:cytochrome c oxidase cbb3-type subunit III